VWKQLSGAAGRWFQSLLPHHRPCGTGPNPNFPDFRLAVEPFSPLGAYRHKVVRHDPKADHYRDHPTDNDLPKRQRIPKPSKSSPRWPEISAILRTARRRIEPCSLIEPGAQSRSQMPQPSSLARFARAEFASRTPAGDRCLAVSHVLYFANSRIWSWQSVLFLIGIRFAACHTSGLVALVFAWACNLDELISLRGHLLSAAAVSGGSGRFSGLKNWIYNPLA